eukprot:g65508.t1
MRGSNSPSKRKKQESNSPSKRKRQESPLTDVKNYGFASQSEFEASVLSFIARKRLGNLMESASEGTFRQCCLRARQVTLAMLYKDGSSSFRPSTLKQRQMARKIANRLAVDEKPAEPLCVLFRFDQLAGDSAVVQHGKPQRLDPLFADVSSQARLDSLRSSPAASPSSHHDLPSLSFSSTQVQRFFLPLTAPPKPAQRLQHLSSLIWQLLGKRNCEKVIFSCTTILSALLFFFRPELSDLYEHVGGVVKKTKFELPTLMKLHSPAAVRPTDTTQLVATGQLLQEDMRLLRLAELEAVREAWQDMQDVHALWHGIQPQLASCDCLEPLLLQEAPIAQILSLMEYNGIGFEGAVLKKQRQKIQARLRELEAQAQALVKKPFLITSSQQVAHILFDELKLPKVTGGLGKGASVARGLHSTSEPVLMALCDKHELPRLILDHRRCAKMEGTYIEPMLGWATGNGATQRIHCWWIQIATATGRLSSRNPNVMSLPSVKGWKGAGLDVNIRAAFRAIDEGHRLVTADYQQLEMRVLAHVSGCRALLQLFAQSKDVYVCMASIIFNVPVSEVSAQKRSFAKTVSLGIVYGLGAQNLAAKLSKVGENQRAVPQAQAQSLIKLFYTKFPGVKKFLDNCKQFARTHGFVGTLSNRRRQLEDIRHADFGKRGYAERQSVNSVIQGSASDIMKLAMLRIQTGLRRGQPRLLARLVLQVHDEIVLEVPKDQVPEVSALLKDCMENVLLDAKVRFPVQIKQGVNLGSLVLVENVPESTDAVTSSETHKVVTGYDDITPDPHLLSTFVTLFTISSGFSTTDSKLKDNDTVAREGPPRLRGSCPLHFLFVLPLAVARRLSIPPPGADSKLTTGTQPINLPPASTRISRRRAALIPT